MSHTMSQELITLEPHTNSPVELRLSDQRFLALAFLADRD